MKKYICRILTVYLFMHLLMPVFGIAGDDHKLSVPVEVTGVNTSVELKIVQKDDEGNVIDQWTQSVNGEGELEFSFDRMGNYRFEVTQVKEDPGIAYDDTVWIVDVFVGYPPDSEEIALIAKVYYIDDDEKYKYDGIYFENPGISIQDPPIYKVIKNDKGQNDEFVFCMVALTEGAPMPEGSSGNTKTVTINGADYIDFGGIIFTRAGTFRYEIYELNTGLPGVIYDDRTKTVYEIEVVVTVSGSQLNSVRTIRKNGELYDPASIDPVGLRFENEYRRTGPPWKIPSTGVDLRDPNFYLSLSILIGLICLSAEAVIIMKKKKAGQDR